MGSDVPGILDCLGEAFEDYRMLYTQGAYLDTVLTEETLQQRLTKMLVYVAAGPSKEIAGTIACNVVNSEEGHIRGMAVLPKWRGTGLAARLLGFAESELLIRKCARVTLDTTEPLRRALRFYEKQGYRRSGKTADFFGMRLIEYHKALRLEDISGG
jgi:GNAT superfamily N-acetyltransferase